MFGIRMVKICLCVAIVLGEAALAADFPDLPPDPDRTALEITDDIYEITADVNPDNELTGITITAPIGSGAGLVVGSAAWKNEELLADELTMSGAGTASIFPNDGALPTAYTGYAVLGVNNGNNLFITGDMTVGGSSWVAVGYDFNGVANTPGDLRITGSLVLNGARSEIWIGNGSELYVNQTISIDEGTLKVEDSGRIEVDGLLSAVGNRSVISMGGGVITSDPDSAAQLFLENSASLLVTEGSNQIDIDVQSRNSTIDVSGGTLIVPSLTMEGAGARLSVADGAGLSGGGTGKFSQTGGVTTVAGNMGEFTEIAVDGGTFTVADTGVLDSSLVQTGGTVEIAGMASEIDISNGTLLLNGNTKFLDNLDVRGTANVTVKTNVSTPLVMTGGIMTLAGGTLTMENTGTLGGVWNVNGGSAIFDGAGAVTFSGGKIDVTDGSGGGFTMNGGGGLRIESSLTVNDNMTVAMDGGAFVLNGGYHVGNSAGSYAMLTVNGSGTFGVEAGTTITLDTGARREYNGLLDQGDTTMLILGAAGLAAGTNAPLGSLTWTSGTSNYTFDVVNGDAGYGLYVTGVTRLTRPETEQRLLDQWSQHPNVDGNVGRVFNDSFIDAVVDGSLIAENENIRATLDPSGKVNAEALAKILEGPSATGYDALMLYNGAGLTAANDAVLNVNRHFLRRVSDRAGVIRREVIVDELEQPETINEAEDPNRRLYGDPAATRLWAEGLVYSDSAGGGEGFAGYDYSGRGLMIGADKRENDIWYGAALAYLPGSFEDKAARSGGGDIDTYAMLAHAGWQDVSGLYVTGTLGYAYADNALRDTRTLGGASGTNEADFGTHSFMVALEAGSDFHLGDYLIITPSAGLAYVTSRGGAHQQWFRGIDVNDEVIGAQTIDAGKITGSSFSLPLGLAASMDVYGDEDSLLSITGKAGYAYELQNKGARGEFNYGGLGGVINPVSAASRAPGRHTWNLGLSARYLYDNMEFGLGYEYLGRGESTAHSVTFSAGVNF